MSPKLATNDQPYENLGNPKGVSKGNLSFTGSVAAADLTHFRFSKLGVAVSGTARARIGAYPSPSLAVSVLSVLDISAKPEVVGADAGWIVAGMADTHSIRNRPEMQFPREPMGAICLPAGDCDLAVAVFVSTRRPDPTRATAINVRPKPLNHGLPGILSRHLGLILQGVSRATVTAVRPLSIVSRPLSSDGALTLGAGMVAI